MGGESLEKTVFLKRLHQYRDFDIKWTDEYLITSHGK
jgi:hypothetical protein